MADNVPITAGSGTNVASDDIGGVQYQRVKPAHGADGSATDVSSVSGLPVQQGQPAVSTGTITTAASTVAAAVTGYSSASISCSGTYTGVVFIVEGSDDGGTIYYPIQAVVAGGAVLPNTTWTPGTNGQLLLNVALHGYTHLRVRATAWASGTANIRLSPSAASLEPAVGIGSPLPTGASMIGYVGQTAGGASSWLVHGAKPATSTLANVAASASSVVLRASAATRMGLFVFNDSTSVLYLKYGATASATSFTVRLDANDYWEMPEPHFTGTVDGIWATATGNARVTELTP